MVNILSGTNAGEILDATTMTYYSILGNGGDDTIYGTSLNNFYYYQLGDGNDTIYDPGASNSGGNILHLYNNTSIENITSFARIGDDLVMSFSDGGSITIKDNFLMPYGSFYMSYDNDYAAYGDLLDPTGQYAVNRSSGSRVELSSFEAWTIGTNFSDDLYGNHQENTILGRGGNDNIYAGDHNDTVHGEQGHDTIYGGNGMDVIDGGSGSDTIYGDGDGATASATGSENSDIVYAGDGNDIIYGGFDADGLWGGQGNDIIYASDETFVETPLAGLSKNVMHGGIGNDTIYGASNVDLLVGGEGNDIMHGKGGSDIYLFGSYGSTTSFSEINGDDTVYETGGSNDEIRFWNSHNISYDASDFVFTRNIYDLVVRVDGYGSMTFKNHFESSGASFIEHFVDEQNPENNIDFATYFVPWGTEGNDVIIGTPEQDIIDGLGGNDKIYGREDDDIIYGGSGSDRLYGEDGNDTLYGGEGFDRVYGGDGNDTIYATEGNDYLYGQGGDDIFVFDDITDFAGANRNIIKGGFDAGDALDLSDLIDYTIGDILSDYVSVTSNASNTIISVDADGGVNNYTTVAIIQNVTGAWTDADDMVAQGNLIVV